jgi:hypothetical protein
LYCLTVKIKIIKQWNNDFKHQNHLYSKFSSMFIYYWTFYLSSFEKIFSCSLQFLFNLHEVSCQTLTNIYIYIYMYVCICICIISKLNFIINIILLIEITSSFNMFEKLQINKATNQSLDSFKFYSGEILICNDINFFNLY